MADIIEPFFEQFTRPQFFPLLSDIAGSCRFDIEGVGSWMVTIRKGITTITKSRSNTKADSTITGGEQVFENMIQMRQNPLTAFLRGLLSITGDIGLAQLGTHIFRMQPEAALQQRERGQIR